MNVPALNTWMLDCLCFLLDGILRNKQLAYLSFISFRGCCFHSIRGWEGRICPEWLWIAVHGDCDESCAETMVLWSGNWKEVFWFFIYFYYRLCFLALYTIIFESNQQQYDLLWMFFPLCAVWAWCFGGMPGSAPSQPTAPGEQNQGLPETQQPRLHQPHRFCHGECEQVVRTTHPLGSFSQLVRRHEEHCLSKQDVADHKIITQLACSPH